MTIIDENGRLFGAVNVFDALVVLVALAMLGAGLVVVNPFAGSAGVADDGESATRYATVDLGERSPAVAERISEGDAGWSNEGTDGLEVTDVYVGPGANETASVVVRVRVPGTLEGGDSDESAFEFDGAPLRRGDQFAFETSEYEAQGEVLELAAEGDSLRTETTPVLVETTLPRGAAAYVETGDEHRFGDRTVATLDETAIAPAGNPGNRTALLALSVRTLDHDGADYVGDDRLVVGRSLPFRTDTYALSGSVVSWGNDTSLETSETTVDVQLEDVSPEVVDDIETGMVERRGNTTTARVTEKRTEPASVIVTTDDGTVVERDHPTDSDVTLTVELRARETDDGLYFHTNRLREGGPIVLDFRTIVLDGTVVEIDR